MLYKNIVNNCNYQKNLCKKFNIIQENAHRAMGDVSDLESLMNQIFLYYGDAINKEQITNNSLNNTEIFKNHVTMRFSVLLPTFNTIGQN